MRRVVEAADVALTAALARDIWTRHYGPIIGRAQTDYMLDRIQSVSAIAAQLGEGCEYFLAMDGDDPAGYFALVPHIESCCALLSKIYVLRERRGAGVGKAMLAFVEARCSQLGVSELWLTVNRHNTDSIAFYQRMGFTITGTIVQDIGHGFVMDDYRMAKAL